MSPWGKSQRCESKAVDEWFIDIEKRERQIYILLYINNGRLTKRREE